MDNKATIGRISREGFFAGWVAVLVAALASLPASASEPTADSQEWSQEHLEFFERSVRPLLAERCFRCHGERKQESSLRLDSMASLLRGGNRGEAISLQDPADSLLLKAVRREGKLKMPPEDPLTTAEVATLDKWVQLGAPWPNEAGGASTVEPFDLEARRASHWAWQPVGDPKVPQVEESEWPLTAIDNFVLARLNENALRPAREADRATWLRRVTFALIGLPPTADDVEAFVADDSPQAYEQVVDRLLASPHFGERWARHWMDLVRYAETYGHEFDYPIPGAFEYRDYLIRAFNDDVPYDQFVREHIAGDLLKDPRINREEGFNESVIGTASWWFGEATHAPTDVRGDEAGRIDNQIDVLTKTFMGMTFACARCHDHKFDAISTADYYALAGLLQSSSRTEAVLDRQGSMAAAASELARAEREGTQLLRKLIPPRIDILKETLLAVAELGGPAHDSNSSGDSTQAYDAQFSTVAAKYSLEEDVLRRWVDAIEKEQGPAFGWAQLWRTIARQEIEDPAQPLTSPLSQFRKSLENTQQKWQAFEKESVSFAELLANQTQSGQNTDRSWHSNGLAFASGDPPEFALDLSQMGIRLRPPALLDSGRLHNRLQGTIRSPTFTLEHDAIHYLSRGKDARIRLIIDGYFMAEHNALLFKGVDQKVDSPDAWTWIVQAKDIANYKGHRAHIELEDLGDGYIAVDKIRFSNRKNPPPGTPEPALITFLADRQNSNLEQLAVATANAANKSLERFADEMATEADFRFIAWLLENDLIMDSATADASEVASDLQAILRHAAMTADKIQPAHHVVALGEASPENSAIHVRGNHRNLGEIVPRRMPEALGGEQVPHNGGSGRLLLAETLTDAANPLTSRVIVNRIWHYMTGRGLVATVDNFGAMGRPPTHPELLDYLARRFVHEGWSIKNLIREIALSRTFRMSSKPHAAAAVADPGNEFIHSMRIRRLEGEAIRDAVLAVSGRLDTKMYGPSVRVHLTPFMKGRGRPSSGPLDGDGRRSLYVETRRNFLSPMMLAYDTPIPFTTIGRRNRSNVPAQALILLNDPFIVAEAKRWSGRVLNLPGLSNAERISQMVTEAFSRRADEWEIAAAKRFLAQQVDRYQHEGLSAESADKQAWADLAHVYFNVKEFVLIY